MALAVPGNIKALIASRISYLLDLKGPALLIDTACSSSLTAIHVACQGIRNGKCEQAIAGGISIAYVSLKSNPEEGLGIESSTGRTHTFDDSSDGTGGGEGVAAVLLKPLNRAIKDRDPIYAVIKGSSINQDGSSIGITAPNTKAQAELILSAWKDAGVDPETISYIEAHGTGTKLGDPVEVDGIRRAFGKHTARKQFCAIGSAKTNIGHLDSAAGIAGFIKAVLALGHQEIPPSLHFKKPNRKIDFEDSPVYVNDQPTPWEAVGFPRRCGVSAFGLSGTNCHIVLEEAPVLPGQGGDEPRRQVLALSAKSENSLAQLVQAYQAALNQTPEMKLESLSFTANAGRGHYSHRLAVICDDFQDLRDKLGKLDGFNLHKGMDRDVLYGKHAVVAESKPRKEPGDIGEADQRQLDLLAGAQIQRVLQSGAAIYEKELAELCQLYIRGAEIAWEELYNLRHVSTVHLPTYPFERKRCWLEIPDLVAEPDENLFHTVGWEKQALKSGGEESLAGKKVLILHGETGTGVALAEQLRAGGSQVIDVKNGPGFGKIDGNTYTIGLKPEDYEALFQAAKDLKINTIIHAMTLMDQTTISQATDLNDRLQKGVFSLFYLVKAINKNRIKERICIFLISKYAHEVTHREAAVNPENAALFGLGKAVGQEYANLSCRALDLEDLDQVGQIMPELRLPKGPYLTAYRDGERYLETVAKVRIANAEKAALEIREQGVYLITGGTGGIGLELGRYLASKKRITLALMNRNTLPGREEWDDILQNDGNRKLGRQIRTIREIEATGSKVVLYRGDVADEAALQAVIGGLRENYGRINGIIHSAGVAGDGYIINRTETLFNEVLRPKVHGTWLLDHLTRADQLDFMVMCSSMTTVLGAPGQGDYTAANSYLDSFAWQRNRRGQRTLTINWTGWSETGMALDYGGNDPDGIFRPISNRQAISAFDQVLNRKISSICIGAIGYGKLAGIIHDLPVRFSDEMARLIEKAGKVPAGPVREQKAVPIGIKGGLESGYTAVQKKLAYIWAETLGLDEISIYDSFHELGGDSILATHLVRAIDKEYPGLLDVSDVFSHPTVAEMSACLEKELHSRVEPEPRSQEAAQLRWAETAGQGDSGPDQIAIIGMACRFPGAQTIGEFWNVLQANRDCIGDFPPTRRRDIDPFLAMGFGTEYNRGGYLDEIDKFDAAFFRISPKEAELMDPAQRLFLAAAWEAIEDAGLAGEKITGSKTGVYVGKETTGGSGYTNNLTGQDLAGTGATTSIIASRLSYILDLAGPALVIDTACSSSLVALHMASWALADGEIETAIAGGVSLSLLPVGSGMIDSEDQKIASFDQAANGTVWGEGIGAVILKPLRKALRDKNNIYAVIKGSAINNDGASNGITAPSAQAQKSLIRQAWQSAKVDPETISYIEAHGTGTKLGDPIEIKGITLAFEGYTEKKQFCGIGTVKTNIGHTVGAAGIASVIKMALSLKNRQLPATLNFNRPHPLIPFTQSPVYINDQLVNWNTGGFPRRCGISSFGFSGTNCYVIMEEAPEVTHESSVGPPEYIFILSVKSEELLGELIQKYREFFDNNRQLEIGDICYTASTGRSHHHYRLAIITRDLAELAGKLESIGSLDFEAIPQAAEGIFCGKHLVVFNKQDKEAGELSEEEKIRLSKTAAEKITGLAGEHQNYRRVLEEICRLYIAGAEIEWTRLYQNGPYQTLSLPVYPFKRERHWARLEKNLIVAGAKTENRNEIGHLLLDRCLARTFRECIFETRFQVEKQWVLSEHRITGKSVIPGTTYLEMAMRAGKEYLQRNVTGLENVQFYAPLVFEEDTVKNVQTIIRVDPDRITFTIASCADESEARQPEYWTVHADGELMVDELRADGRYDLNSLLLRFGAEIEIPAAENQGVMTFGPRWRTIARARLGEGEALVYLEMLPELINDVDHFTLHPALLDIATSIGSGQAAGNNLPYLPFTYGKVKVYSPIPARCYSYIHPLVRQEDPEIIKYQVEILDETGKLVVEIQDFAMKKVRDIKGRIQELSGQKELFYRTVWMPETLKPGKASASTGDVLIFKDTKGISEKIASHFSDQGRTVVLVELGTEFQTIGPGRFQISGSEADYERLMAEVKGKEISLILHLQTITGNDGPATVHQLEEEQRRGVYSLFYLTRAISKAKIRNDSQIVLIAEDVHEITKTEPRLNPGPATLFGLGKVVGQENSNLRVRSLDIDENTSAGEIIQELQAESLSYLIAYRNGQRYREVLDPVTISGHSRAKVEFKSGGVYLITGGTGGIGLAISRYLASQAGVNLALINRTKFPERDEWNSVITGETAPKWRDQIIKIREIEQTGAVVDCYRADVSKFEEMEALITGLRNKYGKINGVIHSAGVAGDGFIIRKNEAAFSEVLAAKVKGAWILDRLTQGDQLDFFVLCSSLASLLAGTGQGDYTAANCYLDALAFSRNRRGRKTIAINWPAWKETGMAVAYGVNHDSEFKALSTNDAISAFDQILHRDFPRIIVGELNYQDGQLPMEETWLVGLSPRLKSVLAKWKKQSPVRRTKAVNREADTELRIHGKKDQKLSETQLRLAKIWANSLGLKEISIYDDFYGLGGDSILAIKIVNEIRDAVDRRIDISDLFDYPTVDQLAEYLDARLEKGSETITKPTAETHTTEKEFDLSSAQKRIWFLQKYDPEMTAYNLPGKSLLHQKLEIETLTRALNYLIRRHEALRTVFRETGGIPKQVVLKELQLDVKVEDLSMAEDQEQRLAGLLQLEDSQAFKMSKPLIKVKIFKLGEEKYCVYYNMHHILIDGWSSEIFITEFLEVYDAYLKGNEPSLPPLTAGYSGWVERQQAWLATGEADAARDYWLSELAKPLPVLNLPLDFQRPALQTFRGSHLPVRIGKEDLVKLKEVARQLNSTLHMVLLSVYFLFLQKITRDRDIIVGLPIAGRDSREMEKVIGLFINTICIRVKFPTIDSFAGLVRFVKGKSLQAYKNGKFPFDLLISMVNPDRNPNQNPIFATMFQLYDNIPPANDNVSKFEINFLGQEINEEIVGRLEYKTDLFEKATVEKFRDCLLKIIREVGGNPDQALNEIAMVRGEEKQQAIAAFNEDLENE
jgi:acyl transferase domain-containing protein/acyl carrier protein